jgi:DNA-binding SARP family transcriptional activator
MKFAVLGPVDVRHGVTAVAFDRPRQRAVLGYVLLNAGRGVTVDQLVEALWGGTGPSTARSQVQSDVAAIRRMLARFGSSCLSKPASGAYRIDVAPEDLDLQMFLDLVRRARQALPIQPRQAAEDLRDALALWRGTAFADVRAAYVEAARVWLDESRLTAYELIAEAELALGRYPELITELTPIVHAHPLRETLATRLMLALYRAGRQADALQVARHVRAELADREGLDPSQAVIELETAILRRDPALDHEPAAEARPARGGPPVVPAQLPPSTVSFVGRQDDIDRLDALLAAHTDAPPPASNLVVALVGTAGVGKTTLAVHWAHKVRHRFPDGQFYADIRSYSSAPRLRPIDVLARFLTALGVPDNQIPSELDRAVALYRSLLVDRRVLVLLDNVEGANDVRPLLPGGGCLVVATSRNRMSGLVARDGAQQIVLDVLGPDEATAMITHILGVDQVAAEPEAAATLAAACAGLPLALGIAAANILAHPVRSIRDHVSDLQVGDSLSALELACDHDIAVRAAFEPSYQALAAPARRLLRLCGLVPGPDVTAEAAAALADTSAVPRLLDELTSAHLLTEHTPGRYSLHDLLRQYAVERAVSEDSADERGAALRRLYAHYVATADAAVDLVKPGSPRLGRDEVPAAAPPRQFATTAEALSWLASERANMVAAVRAAAADGIHRAAGRLADALRGYLWVRSNVVDWLLVDTVALSAAIADDDLAAEAAAHLSLGSMYSRSGRFSEAERHHGMAVERYQRLQDRDGLAVALNCLGHVHRNTGRLADAAKSYEDALTLQRDHGEPAAEAVSMLSLGLVYQDMGRLRPAAEYACRAAELFRVAGSRHGEGGALSSLGDICLALGRYERVREHLGQALRLTREAGSQWNEAETLRVLAEVARDTGRYAEAMTLVGQAFAIAASVDADLLRPYVANTQGSVLRRMGGPEEAIEHHRAALEQARRHEARMPELDALLGLAAAYADLRQVEGAGTAAQHALGLARRFGYRLQEGHALAAVGRAHLLSARPGAARNAAAQALAVYRACHHPLGEGRTLLLLGHAQETEPERAVEHWRQAVDIFAALGVPDAAEARAALDRVASRT